METFAGGITVLASNIRGCEDIVPDNKFHPSVGGFFDGKFLNIYSNEMLDVSFTQNSYWKDCCLL